MSPHRVGCRLPGGLFAALLAAGALPAGLAQAEDVTAAVTTPDPATVETVVVTARKREERQQDVPVALSVVDAQTIAERGLDKLTDLGSLTPNFQVTDRDSIRTIFIRGVGGGGRQVGFETRAGVYIDGVYVGAPPASDTLLLDLDRAEILRGPQGYLFGQNSTSGAVSLVTHAPVAGLHQQLAISTGNKGERHLAGTANFPLAEDNSVLLRLSANGAWRDSFTRNIVTDEDVDDLRDAGGRMRLRWLASPDLTLDLAGDAAREATHVVGGEPRTSTFGNGPTQAPAAFETSNNTQEHDVNHNRGVSATAAYKVAGGELTSISAWRRSKRNWTVDADRSSSDWVTFFYVDDFRYLSQELRFAAQVPEWKLHYLVGLYALGSKAEASRVVFANDGIGTAPGAVGRIVAGDALSTLPDIDGHSYAAFGSLDYALSEQFTLNAGVRVTRTGKNLRFDQTPESFTAIGGRALLDYRDKLHETSVDPTVGLQYFTGGDGMAYVKYAHGSKSGGFDADFLSGARPAPEKFDQEKVDSYETGYKTAFFGNRLRTDLSVFLADYHDYQVTQSVTDGGLAYPATTNAGRVRTAGPELSVAAQALPGLSLSLDAAWLYAEYREFKDAAGIGTDYSGNRAEYAPKINATFGTRYEHTTPWTGSARAFLDGVVSYRGSEFAQPSNADNFRIGKRTVTNLRTGFSQADGAWEVGLYADNLFQEHYDESLQTGTLGTLFGRRGDPRTYGLQARVNW